MSDTPESPQQQAGDPAPGTEDAAVENAVFAEEAALDTAEERAEVKRRVWFMRMLRRERRREKVAKDRTTLISSFVTVLSTAVVAGTAMYATLKTSSDGRLETRRGARVDALVDHWSSTIADASTAIELLGQRSNDLWAYALALSEQGVILEDALTNESGREKDYLSVRKNLAATTARAGLVSSVSTTECLDRFVGLLDTWNNALTWTRSSVQIEESVDAAVQAVKMQYENRSSLDGAITIVRTMARQELAKAGEARIKCNIPDVDTVWSSLVPSGDGGSTEDTTPGSN